MQKAKKNGFTLIEILVVIGIIAILAAIVLIAINPARQFAQARDTQRTSNVEAILNAIGQNIADNRGIFTCSGATISTNPLASSTIKTGSGGTAPTGTLVGSGTAVDLSLCLSPKYLPTIPSDPDNNWAAAPYTGYDVSVDTNGRYTVCAPRAGSETVISSPAPAVCITR